MSSRNKYLHANQRQHATVLWQAIQRARNAVKRSVQPVNADKLQRELKAFIEQQPEARVDYLQFFDANSFVPARSVSCGTQMALAVFMGKTRLIDNGRL
jgi:pantoate--beta-alanine ligase